MKAPKLVKTKKSQLKVPVTTAGRKMQFFRNSNRHVLNAQWAFIAQNGMEKAPKSTVFSTIFNNGNLYMTIRQPRIHF